MPHPSAHAYWVPDRFTPRSWTGLPTPSTSWLPVTRSESGVGGGDVLVEDAAEDDAAVDEPVDEPVEGGAVDEAGALEVAGAMEVAGALEVAGAMEVGGAAVDAAPLLLDAAAGASAMA